MDFIQHTQNWIQGEMFEAVCIAVGGALLLILSVLALIFGSSPHVSSMTLPFAMVGLLLVLGGILMYRGNMKRMMEFPERYRTDPKEFVVMEKARVETFDTMYSGGKAITIALLIIGLTLAYLLRDTYLRSIGLGLIVLGVSIVFIDHFSKERASIYYGHIQKYLSEQNKKQTQ